MNRLRNKAAVAIGLVVALASCTSSFYLEHPDYKVPTGYVLDERERPVEGAIVAISWSERTVDGWSGWTVCRYARTVTTDASGSYAIPTYHGHYPTNAVPYKRGTYRLARPNSEHERPINHLAMSSKTGDDRVKEIWEDLAGVGCGLVENEDAASMKVLWLAIADELRQLPSSTKRDETLRFVDRHARLYK